MKRAAAIGFAILAAMAAAPSARADALDGDWCSAEGKKLTIKGPEIRLPSGTTLKGDYRRHEFLYQAPAGEDHSGDIAYLAQQSEELMQFRWIENGTPGEPETWRRCNVTS
jgi:hypothetical protein